MPKQRSDGEGSVALWPLSKTPETRYYARRRVVAPDGTAKRITAYGRTMPAAIKAREVKVEAFLSSHPEGGTITLKQAAARWLSHKQHTIKSSTVHDYAKTLRLHVLPYIGERRLDELTLLDLQDCLSVAASEGKLNAADKARKVLKMIYRQAVRWELVARNPTEMLDPILKHPPKRGLWQPEEQARFLEHVKPYWYYPLYYTALSTGMRRGEIVALRWQDVRGSSIFVNRTYSQVGKDWVMGEPKTRESKRNLPMSPSLQELMSEHRIRLEVHAAKTRRDWHDQGLVFPSQTGGLLYPPNLRLRLTYYAKQAGVPVIRFHDLRRIYASNFIRAGGDPKQLQRRLGHASPDLAMSIYTDVFEDDSSNPVFDLAHVGKPTHKPTLAQTGQNDGTLTEVAIDALLLSESADEG